MESFESFIASEIATSRKARILTVSHQLPNALYDFEGDLAYIGYSKPTRILASPNCSIRVVDAEHDILAALRRLASHRQENFDVIIFDTDHTAATLAAQINAVHGVRAAETVFLFPGAIPPRRSVGTSKPTEAWWTGDVWTLPGILEKTGAACLVSGAAPVGFLMATCVSDLDVTETIAESSRIQGSVADDAAFREFIKPASNLRLVEAISKALGRLVDGTYVRIIVDPDEPDVRSSQVVDAFKAWLRPPPAFVIDLSNEKLSVNRLYESDRSVQGVTLDQFGACHVLGRDVILCGYGQGQSVNCYGRNIYPEVTRANLQLLADEEPLRGDLATLIEAREGALCVQRGLLDEAELLDQPVFLGTPDEHRNYGMWLLYSVPGVKLFQSVKEDYPRFLAFQGAPWQSRMLIELGVKPEEIVRQSGECGYRCSGLATMRQSYRSLALSAGDLEAFDDFGERAMHGQAAGPARIFVSRLSHTRAGAYRGLPKRAGAHRWTFEAGFRGRGT